MAGRAFALPLVDLAAGRTAAAAALRRGASGPGFFYLVNHGVPVATQERTFQALERFFALPEETKMKINRAQTGNFRGYIGFFEQGSYGVDETDKRQDDGAHAKAAEKAPLDFKEVFHIGTELSQDHPFYTDLLYSDNVWPEGEPEFRAALTAYYDEMLKLSEQMHELFALALDLPPQFFASKARTTPMNSMNCVHYPPLNQFAATSGEEASADQMGIGAHTDFEAFTLLNQHGAKEACLDVYAENGWTAVPPIEGGLVVNVGDMLARWSGDLFRSTVHRARNPTSEDRTSIAFFSHYDFDAFVSPKDLPSHLTPERKYAPVRAGDHMLKRVAAANLTDEP